MGGGSYRRTADIGAAELFTRGLGIGFVQFWDDDLAWNNSAVIEEIANNVNEALDFLRVRGVLNVPRRIETNRRFFEEAGRQNSAWAVYIHNPLHLSGLTSSWIHLNRAILFNPRIDWPKVDQTISRMHRTGYLSTSDPHHFVYHEMGHMLLEEDHPKRNRLTDSQALQTGLPKLVPHISRRAQVGATEFVAEIFAQLIVGVHPVNPQVLALYQQLGGLLI
jgi:hypothetical protein